MPSLAGQDPRYLVKAMKAYRAGERDHGPMINAMEAISDKGIDDLATFYAAQMPIARNVRAPLSTREAYLKTVMGAYADGARGDSMMHAMASPLSAADVERLAAYYSMQAPRSVIYVDLPCAENP